MISTGDAGKGTHHLQFDAFMLVTAVLLSVPRANEE